MLSYWYSRIFIVIRHTYLFLDIQPKLFIIIHNRYPFYIYHNISNNVIQVISCNILFYPWFMSVINIHGQLTMHCPNPSAPLQPPCQYPFISLYTLSYHLTFKWENKLHRSVLELSTLRILNSRFDHCAIDINRINMSFCWYIDASVGSSWHSQYPAPARQTTGPGATLVTGPEPGLLLARGQAVAPGGGEIKYSGLPLGHWCAGHAREGPNQAGRRSKPEKPKTKIEFPAESMVGMIFNLILKSFQLFWCTHP